MISHPQVSVYIPWNRTLKRGSKRLCICATVNVLKSAEQGQEERVLMVVFPKRERLLCRACLMEILIPPMSPWAQCSGEEQKQRSKRFIPQQLLGSPHYWNINTNVNSNV